MSSLIPDNVKRPKEALSYCPTPNIIFFGKGKSAQRFIFRNQELTPFENEKLTRLELELQKSKINVYALHPTWDRQDLLRFCYGTGWKTRVAKEVVIKYLKWKESIMPNGYLSLFPKVSKILVIYKQETGCVYIHGRDIHYRPILVLNFNKFNLKKVLSTQFSTQEYIYLIGFILDFVIENMLCPGHVENWVVISDFEKSGFGELGFKSLKQVMGILTDNYRCRLGCNYVVNPAKIVYYMWSCMKPFLDDVLIEKVKILNKPHPDELFSHCNPYQVEEKYGGKAPNVQIFWPPILPNAPYALNAVPCHLTTEENFDKSFESELNVVEEKDCNPMRRSLTISGQFEVRTENEDDFEKKLREERRKLKLMKKEMKEKERVERIERKQRRRTEREEGKDGKYVRHEEKETEEDLGEVCMEVMGKDRDGKGCDNDLEPEETAKGVLIPFEAGGTAYETERKEVGCGMCRLPEIKSGRCTVF